MSDDLATLILDVAQRRASVAAIDTVVRTDAVAAINPAEVRA